MGDTIIQDSSIYGLKVETFNTDGNNNRALYEIGDTVSLALQLDSTDILAIGDTIDVEIRDIFDNLIATVIASRINDVYIAEWTVPLAIHRLYNTSKLPDISPDKSIYFLSDKWIFPDGQLGYEFLVNRSSENAVIDNAKYIVSVTGLYSSVNDLANDFTLTFGSKFAPYYSTVEDVRSVLSDELRQLDDFEIARDIIMKSKQVDLFMTPNKIFYKEQFDLAVKMYVKYGVARQHLIFLLNINAESKEIDMLKYSKNSGDPEKALEHMDNMIIRFGNIILAGGKDTPYIPHTFTKGIFDPNRPNVSRASLDVSDPYPWVNTTTQTQVLNIGGNMVELRGVRTVAFLKSKVSNPDVYLRSEGVS